jgi:hypothetical protein
VHFEGVRTLPMMNAVLTATEMRRRFEDQWVLVEDPRFDQKGKLRSGSVLAHSPKREEIYQRLREAEARSMSVEYLGEVPADLAVAL